MAADAFYKDRLFSGIRSFYDRGVEAFMRKLILTVVLLTGAIFAGCTAGVESGGGSTQKTEPVAIDGYDSVAYFAADKARRGNPQFSFAWEGANWIFENAENLNRFRTEPERYAPQFGSHCPVSLSSGGNEKGDPRFWRVVKDKLYIFYKEGYADQFDKDPEAVLKKAAEADYPK